VTRSGLGMPLPREWTSSYRSVSEAIPKGKQVLSSIWSMDKAQDALYKCNNISWLKIHSFVFCSMVGRCPFKGQFLVEWLQNRWLLEVVLIYFRGKKKKKQNTFHEVNLLFEMSQFQYHGILQIKNASRTKYISMAKTL
jgi:hypothetical protein